MADTKISALTEQTTLEDANEFPLADSGASKRVTWATLKAQVISDATNATQAELDAHVNDTTDAHDASAISFVAGGTIAGTDVQTAVAEVATDAASALSAHEADTTNIHGITDTSALLTTSAAAAAYQPLDATLSALAAANWAANNLPIGTGADTLSQTSFAANTFPARASSGNLVAKTVTDFGLSLVDDTDASAARTTLGLGTIATQASNNVTITGGAISGITDLPVADGGTGASTASAARTNLGIATAVGGVEWTVITKAIDESVSSSTAVQIDDELQFSAVSGAFYEFQCDLVYGSPNGAGTPDMNMTFAEDGTGRGVFQSLGLATNDAAANTTQITSTGGLVTRGTAAADRMMFNQGVHKGNGGTFGLYWAQQTSGSDATIVRAGSVLRYRRIL